MSNQEALERLLSEHAPFSALPADERRALARSLRPRAFSPGETVFGEGEVADAAWLVVEGSVRILGYYGESRLRELERLGPGQLFGRFCRVGRLSREHQCTAVAESPLRAARVPDEAYDRWLARSPAFSCAASACCAGRLSGMRRLLSSEAEGVERRLARALLALAQGATVRATRRELAVATGAALETVFRMLARMRRRGWLQTSRGRITLKSRPALEAFARGGEAL